jgi:hypothetical protein
MPATATATYPACCSAPPLLLLSLLWVTTVASGVGAGVAFRWCGAGRWARDEVGPVFSGVGAACPVR